MKPRILVVLIVLLGIISIIQADPIGSAIKYNGHLKDKDTGNAATGLHDVIFELWKVASGGDPVLDRVATYSEQNVTIENGVLSVSPDFGEVFNGQAYWIDIQIKKSGTEGYHHLEPRQALGATAYALHAPKAGTAEKANGVNAGAVDTAGLQDSAIEEGKIKDRAVTKGKLAKPSVSKDELEDAAVEEAKIKDRAITKGKLAKPSVSKEELEDSAVEEGKIKDDAVTAAKIKGGEVVKSLNGLKDAVALSAGANVALTLGVSDVQIAVSGGSGSGLDADFLDGQHATAFAGSLHGHSGADITSGTVLESWIDAAIARDNEVLTIVKASDGSGSGLDADLLDGLNSADFWKRTGNSGTAGFLGTTDGVQMEIRVGNTVAMRYLPTMDVPNLVGGAANNAVQNGAQGVTIGGGGGSAPGGNRAGSHFCTIGGGDSNAAGLESSDPSSGTYATVGGGFFNLARPMASTIGGGFRNTIGSGAQFAAVAGGRYNTNTAPFGVIGGGELNQILDLSQHSYIGGGYGNSVATEMGYATIAGGYSNANNAHYGAIGGGQYNQILEYSGNSFIGGGRNNTIRSGNDAGTVAGGLENSIQEDASHSTIGGGWRNDAGASHSTVGGGSWNVVQPEAMHATIPGGQEAMARAYGQMVHASGKFSNAGDAQTSTYVSRGVTTGAAPTVLLLDGAEMRLVVPTNSTWTFDILVTGRTSAGVSAGYQIRGVIKNTAGTTSFVGSTTVSQWEDIAGWDAVVLANDAYDSLEIRVTGALSTTIRWVASVHTVEVTY